LIISTIELIVYDFDGVMTDNRALILQDGSEAVFVNRSDGLAIEMIRGLDIPQVIISTEKNTIVKKRAEKLMIPFHQGIGDKLSCLKEVLSKKNIDPANTIYVGNDINDLDAMKFVGWPIAPRDAHQDILSIAKIVVDVHGGNGVIRKMFDIIYGEEKYD
jgi:3-deoxy-D-manno-octulosonate 8-phosphate phosphatase (KDO 8-P phosphatase)